MLSNELSTQWQDVSPLATLSDVMDAMKPCILSAIDGGSAVSSSTLVVLRNDTLPDWESSDGILRNGEVAFARLSGSLSDSYEMRIGIGSKTWNELSDGGIVVHAKNVAGLEEAIKALSTSYYETDSISTLSGSYVNGDIAVEKKVIDNTHWQFTAYRWAISNDIGRWMPLDSAYKASNVYLSDGMQAEHAVIQLSASLSNALSLVNEEASSRISADEQLSNMLSSSLSIAIEVKPPELSSMLSSYHITQGGREVGVIEVPKDFLVKSAELKTVTEENVPYEGAKPGDRYIDFVINDQAGSAEGSHVYVPVNDLIDVYTGGTTSTVSVEISGDSIIYASVLDNSISTAQIADNAVTSSKILDAQVSMPKLSSDVIDCINAVSSSAIDAVNGKIFIDDISAQSLCAVHISQEDFYEKVITSSLLSNELYIVSGDCINAYGQRIENVGSPVDLSDAATKEYVDIQISSVPDLLSGLSDEMLSNDAFLSNQISALSDNLNILSDNLSALSSGLSSLSAFSDDLSTLSGSLSTLSDGLSIISDNLGALSDSLSTMSDGLSMLSDDLSTLSSSLTAFYLKTQTSSSNEISGALSAQKEWVLDQNYISSVPSTYALKDEVNISYHSSVHKIVLSAGEHTTSVDCNDFIKDGMLSNAYLSDTTLWLVFNTMASADPISVDLSSFVDNYDSKIKALSGAIDDRAMLSDVPLSTSQLSNDSGYIVLSDIPGDLSSFTNSPGYLICSDVSAKIDEITHKIYIDDQISSLQGYSDLSIVKLKAQDYDQLVVNDSTISNGLYIVEDEFEDAYGQQVKNMAPGTDLSDAVNLEQLSSAISSIQIPTDLSAFTNSPRYLVSNDISGFYKKSETSSAAEISNTLSMKADLSSVEHVMRYEQDYNGNYTAATIGSRRSSLSTDIGPNSFVNGYNCQASDDRSHAEGVETSAFGDSSHAEGYKTVADNDGAHAEGSYTSAFGYYSHTEGGWTSTGEYAMGAHAEGGFIRADGPISHVEGVKATAELSDYQSFVWQGTDVMPNELTDITLSTWNEYKAHGPGTFNINPVSGAAGVYIGEQTLASMLGGGIELIEWANLVALAQTSALNPGTKYRITDYVTTVDQEDCRSAEHPFDLIVTAIDRHTLDEHAIATLPSNGDDYFDARPFHVPDYQQYLEYARIPLESWEIKYCLDNDKTRFKFADAGNGKGVIYYMKDEFGNEAPYDFKNVQFKRYLITSSPGAVGLEGMYGLAVSNIEVDESDEMWCYTFNGADYVDFGLSEPYDFSSWHVRPTQAVIQQFGGPSIERLQECVGNVIQARQEDAGDFSLMSFKLPNNVFHCALTETPVGELPFLKTGYCSGNKLGLNCYDNTFGNDCNNNTFGNSCYSNTFGNDCGNKLGLNCYDNTFGNSCYSNTFGNSCYSNTFGNDCNNNTFGKACNSNTFNGSCYNNIFGNNCNGNKFNDDNDGNTFSNNCSENIFGYGCDSNTFGNSCSYIKFASTDTSDPSQAKGYYKFITVDSGNQYILLNCTQSTYDGNEYKNVRILPGVNSTSTYKTITDSNVNQSFCMTYQPTNSQVIAI